MALEVVAFHYPNPEHRDELVRRITAAAEVMQETEGCIEAGCWEERDTGAIVSTGTFASEDAWNPALQAVLAANVDFEYDERKTRPRDVHFLVEPA